MPATSSQPGSQPQGQGPQGQTSTRDEQLHEIIQGNPPAGTSPGQQYGAPRDDHVHSGLDIPVASGTPCFAPMDGEITYASETGFDGGGMVHFMFHTDVGDTIKKNDVIGWGHISSLANGIQTGTSVQRGQQIALSGSGAGGECVHFIYQKGEDGTPDGVSPSPGGSGGLDPTPIYRFLQSGKASASDDGVTSGGSSGSAADIESLAKAAALSTFISFPGIELSAESQALRGERSLMNDQQLLPFIEQLCTASLRQFQSMPNGNFFAFYPDYFGGLGHRTPYWEISDIEIISGQIQLSDDALATHVYVVGDFFPDGQITIEEKIQSAGIITVMSAFMADFLNGVNSPALQEKADKGKGEQAQKEYEKRLKEIPTLAAEGQALAFLNKYGARPYFEEAPMVRAPFFEKFLAYQRFCLLWSKQFLTTFEFTFMPELFPGGIVAFPDHGVQCYIDEVVHEANYESGFTTRANLSAPAALKGRVGKRGNLHEGLIRPALFNSSDAGGQPQSHESGPNNDARG